MSNGIPTFSTNRVSTATAGGGSSFGNAYPVFPAAPGTNILLQENLDRFEGFVGDGDYVVLPDSVSGVDYFNAAGVSQSGWPILPAAINANVDTWVGWMMTSTSTMYSISVDTTTTPHTLYTSSMDSAGTITNIGNEQLGTDFASADYWIDASGVAGTNIFRASDLSGNLFIINTSGGAVVEICEIDITDGSIVSQPTQVYDFGLGSSRIHYRTPNGNYCGNFDFNGTYGLALINIAGDNGQMAIQMGLDNAVPCSTSALAPLMWKGLISVGSGQAGRIDGGGSKNYTKAGFDAAIDAIAKTAGVAT